MIFILFTSHIKTVIANEAKRSAAIFEIASSAKPPRNDILEVGVGSCLPGPVISHFSLFTSLL